MLPSDADCMANRRWVVTLLFHGVGGADIGRLTWRAVARGDHRPDRRVSVAGHGADAREAGGLGVLTHEPQQVRAAFAGLRRKFWNVSRSSSAWLWERLRLPWPVLARRCVRRRGRASA